MASWKVSKENQNISISADSSDVDLEQNVSNSTSAIQHFSTLSSVPRRFGEGKYIE